MRTFTTPSWVKLWGWENWNVRVWLAPTPAIGPESVALSWGWGVAAWVREKILSPMLIFAVREVARVLGAAVQLMVFAGRRDG